MPATPTTATPALDHDAIVIGSGFSGIAMAHRLRKAGNDDFVVLEQADALGGTWRDNHYPGCACDVQSHLYSFSFAPNPEWSRMFAPAPEIRGYLERTATELGLRPHLRFGCEVTAVRYDEGSAIWEVELNGDETLTARVVVSAIGALNKPAYPEIPGIEDFEGAAFHSAEWDEQIELAGKRVAVIGTGASAIQIVPAIAPEVGELTLFQRTPPWILPKRDRRISRLERFLFRSFPAAQRAYRRFIYWMLELRVVGFSHHPGLLRAAQAVARLNIRRAIDDPELRAKVTPDYTMGCKRILISNDYYPALTRDNVELVTEPIERVTERGVVTADGQEQEVDTIIYGTGFRIQQMLADLPITGRDGRVLGEVWDEQGMEAHRGTTVAGFPNLFFLLGPNTGLGHTSIVHMIESQAHYVAEALGTMSERELWAVEVRPEVQAEFNRELEGMLDGAVWSRGGCRSWYLDRNGRNTTLWPDFTFRFRRELAEFRADEYFLTARSALASGSRELSLAA